jgi:hypothetical protein
MTQPMATINVKKNINIPGAVECGPCLELETVVLATATPLLLANLSIEKENINTIISQLSFAKASQNKDA